MKDTDVVSFQLPVSSSKGSSVPSASDLPFELATDNWKLTVLQSRIQLPPMPPPLPGPSRVREDQSRSPRARRAARWLPRPAHDVSVAGRARRRSRSRGATGRVCDRVRRSDAAGRSPQPGLEGGVAALADRRAAARRDAARRGRRPAQAHSRRRRALAAAAPMRRWRCWRCRDSGTSTWTCRRSAGWRRGSAPTCRSFSSAAPRSASAAATTSIRSPICRAPTSSSSGRGSACRRPTRTRWYDAEPRRTVREPVRKGAAGELAGLGA